MTFNAGIEAAAQEAFSAITAVCITEDGNTTLADHVASKIRSLTRPSSSAPVEQREAVAGHGWEGSFTAEEFLERAEDHDKAAKNGLAAGPNVSYVRTFQACSVALRYAAEHMFALPGSSRDEVLEEAAKVAEGYPKRKDFGAAVVELAAQRIADRIRALKSGGAK